MDLGPLTRLLEAEPADVGLVAEASASLALAAAALRLVSLSRLARLSAVLVETSLDRDASPQAEPRRQAERLAWAVDAASRRLGGQCLARSVALLWLLARRGIPGVLCIGFPLRPKGRIGHAWVESAGEPLGADGAAIRPGSPTRFEVLFRRPGSIPA